MEIDKEMMAGGILENVKVIATGGLGRLIADEVSEIDVYDPTLTLKGLYLLYEKNRKNKPQLKGYDNENVPE